MLKMNLKKLKKIKLVLTDVDGVLTDGGMYYSSKGDIMKKFHVRDGMGVNILKRSGIGTIIVTKEKNMIIRHLKQVGCERKWIFKCWVNLTYNIGH